MSRDDDEEEHLASTIEPVTVFTNVYPHDFFKVTKCLGSSH